MLNTSTLVHLARTLGGLPVYGCLPGSPAEEAGVRYGDILLSVDGFATPTWDAYIEARARSGVSILVRIFRDGLEVEFDIPLDRSTKHDAISVAAALGILDEPEGEN